MDPLQHTATHCNTLQHISQMIESRHLWLTLCNTLQPTATHCNTLQHTSTRCNTLQHTAKHCNTLQHTATHCNTYHTATHCNTLQHTAPHDWVKSLLIESRLIHMYDMNHSHKWHDSFIRVTWLIQIFFAHSSCESDVGSWFSTDMSLDNSEMQKNWYTIYYSMWVNYDPHNLFRTEIWCLSKIRDVWHTHTHCVTHTHTQKWWDVWHTHTHKWYTIYYSMWVNFDPHNLSRTENWCPSNIGDVHFYTKKKNLKEVKLLFYVGQLWPT